MSLTNAIMIVLMLFACGRPAASETSDGSAAFLQSQCQSVARIHADQIGPTDYEKAAWCQGYVIGVADAAAISKQPFYLPNNVTVDEMIKVVLRYLDEHPETLHKSAALIVRLALLHAYK